MTLKRIAIVIFFAFVIYNIVITTSEFQWPYLGVTWVGTIIGRNLGDIRLWALGIGIVLLKRRDGGGWWGKKKMYDSPQGAR